jgi:Flp pilus assembly protein TadD
MKSSRPLLLVPSCFCFLLLLAYGTEAVGQTETATQLPEVARILAELQAQPSDPNKQNAARTHGFRLISLGRYEDAWNVFRVVLQAAPRDQQSLYGGALALLNANRIKEARELAESATTVAHTETATATDSQIANNREADALVLLGVILAVDKDNAGALKATRRAVELAPESFDTQFALGRALYGSGDLANAVVSFRKAITLRPQDHQPRFFLGTTYEALGAYEEARQVYSELVRLHPENAEGHLGLGVLLLKLAPDRTTEAISELQKSVALKSDSYEAQVSLGRALIKVGRAADAVEHLNRAAALMPGNPEPHYQLAIAYRRMGKTANAEAETAKVKEINSTRRSSKIPPDNEN